MANGFFSRNPRGNSEAELTAPEPTPTPVSFPKLKLEAKLEKQLAEWNSDLAQLTRIDGEAAPRLTINQAHPGGLAQLYTDHPTRLSLLVRESSAHQRAIERARTILSRSNELTARHGVGTIHMSIGSARWIADGVVQNSAALLRPAQLSEDSGDVTITLLPGFTLDSRLSEAFARAGIALDTQHIVAQATTIHGFSFSAALAALRTHGALLEGFELRDELVLGIFEHPASGLKREFDETSHLLASPIVRALAGDASAIEQVNQTLPQPDPHDRDPWKERGAGDLTPRQLDVIEAVAEGRSFLIDIPDGADDTALVGALLADAAASGRTTLHIGGSPSLTTRAQDRLHELGLGEAATRIDGTTSSGEELRALLRTAMSDTSVVADIREVDDMRTRLREVRTRLSKYTEALHRPYGAFGVSAFGALQVLTDLTSAHPAPATKVRFREEVLLGIAQDQGTKARALLHEAAELGVFSRSTAQAWRGIVIGSAEKVPEVLTIVHRLSHDTIPQLRVRMGVLAGEAGLTPATTLAQWKEQLDLFEGVRDVLDVFQPQIFEQSAADMVIATATKQWRAAHGITMKRSERVRLLKRAQDFVRPGTHLADLHTELLKVQRRREAWREHTRDEDAWPTLPQRLDEAKKLTRAIEEDLAALAPMFATSKRDFHAMPVSALAALFDSLDADPEGAKELPRRVAVLKALGELGLSALVNDLRDRHVDTELIDAEMDLAWWASILGLMLAKEPGLGGFDPAHLEETLEAGRALDAEQVASLAPQALGQLRRLRLQAMATRPEQVDALDTVLDTSVSALELYTSVALVRNLVPIVFTVPTLVPSLLRPGHRVDVLILDDVEGLPLAELVPIIARARQVVVLADLSAASPQGPTAALAAVLPRRKMDVAPALLNDQVALLLARHGVDHTGVPVPYTAASAPVTAHWCEGTGMPAPGAAGVESTAAEVEKVVDLVVAHAVEQPERSLAVIALNARHAERIRQAIQRTRASEPGLASFFDPTNAQPFVVVDPGSVRGLSRDRVIVSVGYAKTPHGRVIHDFGALSTSAGVRTMSDVLRAIRGDLTLVSSLRPLDIDRSRLATRGSLMLADLLEIAEGQSGVAQGGWPVLEAAPDRLLIDLADRLYGMGLEVVANVGIPGGMRIPLAIGHPEVPGRLLVAVLTDDDAYVREPSLRVRDRMWPAMLEAQGWKVYTALSMAVFIDPGKEADTIVGLVLDAVDEVKEVERAYPGVEVPEIEDFAPDLERIVVSDPGLDELVASTSLARERADELVTGMFEVVSETFEEESVSGARASAVVGSVSEDSVAACATGASAVSEDIVDVCAFAVPRERSVRPAIAKGLPLAAYSDDQLDEMALWVMSDGRARSVEETVEELRQALGITRRGFQSDAVLGRVVRRTSTSGSSTPMSSPSEVSEPGTSGAQDEAQ